MSRSLLSHVNLNCEKEYLWVDVPADTPSPTSSLAEVIKFLSFTDKTRFASTFNNMAKNSSASKSSKGLGTPPANKRRKNKDSPDSISTQSLSSMSMSFDGYKPDFLDQDSQPSKRMKTQDIPWTDKNFLLQAFKAVGITGSLKEALSDSQCIEVLLGIKRKPYETTLQKLEIKNSWSKYQTKQFRKKVAEAVANKLRG